VKNDAFVIAINCVKGQMVRDEITHFEVPGSCSLKQSALKNNVF
jgi:hypothetical protein